jgi:hypothetical protein
MASRWLTSVGKFLEKLDDQAKDVVEEQFRRTAAATNNNNAITISSLYISNDGSSTINANDGDDADSKINNLLAAKGLQLSFNSSNSNTKHSFTGSVSTAATAEQQITSKSEDDNSNSNFFGDNDDFFQDTGTIAIPNSSIKSPPQQQPEEQSQQQHHQKQQEQESNQNSNVGWGTEEEDEFFDDVDMNENDIDTSMDTSTKSPQLEDVYGSPIEPIMVAPGMTIESTPEIKLEQLPEISAINNIDISPNNFTDQEKTDEYVPTTDLDADIFEQTSTNLSSAAKDTTDEVMEGEEMEAIHLTPELTDTNESVVPKTGPYSVEASSLPTPDTSVPIESDIDSADQLQPTSVHDTELKNSNTPSIDWNRIIQAKLQEQEMMLIQMSKEREEIIRNEYQNEIRNMKNTIIALNNDLEILNREINAQQKELDTVAIRIDKDRIKQKEIIDTLNTRYTTDMTTLKVQHDNAIKDIQKQHNEKIVSLQEQYRQLELSKIHEDATYNKDLDKVVQREQQLQQQYDSIIDERDVLLQQIETLQQQQASLVTRIESLTVMSENSYQREQESERRYDDILQLHAKQLQQRQMRESELERTITELTAALASSSSSTSSCLNTTNANQDGSINTDNNNSNNNYILQVQTLEHENETIKIQLAHELARSTALEQEIQQITKDREDDTRTEVNQLKKEYEQTISELQQKIRSQRNQENSISNNNEYENEYGVSDNSKGDESNSDKQQQRQQIDTYMKKIKTLSDEIVRQREKLSSYSSEVSTLRTRLNVALNRATVAEAVAEQQQQQIPFGSPDSINDNVNSYNKTPTSGIRMNKRRNNNTESNFPSMRKAFMIDTNDSFSTSNTTVSKLGTVLDATDTVLSKSGRVLRYNPFARLFFGKSPINDFSSRFCLYVLIAHISF